MTHRNGLLVVAAALSLAIAFLAADVLAGVSAFTFTMERRAVHGKGNKKLHALSAGDLKLSGGVWVVSKFRGATATPDAVNVWVRKDQDDSDVCNVAVTPSTTFNQKTSFEKECGRVESGNYWVFIERPKEDGWHLKGSGTLETK